MSAPEFSILIPTRNRAHLLRQAVASVLWQKHPSWELIISDNQSSDDTPAIIRSFGDPRIRAIRPDRFLEVTDHWNFAFRHVTGRHFLLMGDDDLLLPAYLADVFQVFNDYPDVDIAITSQARYYYPDYPEPGNANTLHQGRYSRKIEIEIPARRLTGFFQFRKGFHTSAAVVNVDLLRAIDRGFGPFEAPFPDYYALFSSFSAATRVAKIDRPLVVIGTTAQGLGTNTTSRSKEVSWAQHPLRPELPTPLPGNFFINGFHQALQLTNKLRIDRGMAPMSIDAGRYHRLYLDEVFQCRDNAAEWKPYLFAFLRGLKTMLRSDPSLVTYLFYRVLLSLVPKRFRSWARRRSRGHATVQRLPSTVQCITDCVGILVEHAANS